MRWFGMRAGREESRPALSRGAGSHGGQSFAHGEWPMGYEAQVRAGYLGNAVAQRAVRLVAEAVGSAPLDASDPALLALVTARGGGGRLAEVVAAQVLLHGNAFVQVLRDEAGAVAELYPLRPERVGVVLDAGGWAAGYRYTVGGRVSEIAPDAVIHVRGFHPLDDHYGLGCLGAASGAIAVHNAAGRWNKALLDNAARPSGALMYDAKDGATLSTEQFERLLGDGSRFGVRITYAQQPRPDGLAQAFILGAEHIGDDSVCLVLGDNIFYGPGLGTKLRRFQGLRGAAIFG